MLMQRCIPLERGTGILHDHADKVLKLGASSLQDITTVEHAELLAMWNGLEHVLEFWGTSIDITIYCQLLTLQINQRDCN